MSLGHDASWAVVKLREILPLIPTDVIRDEEQMFTRYETVVAWARHQRWRRLFAEERFVYRSPTALTTPASSIPGTSRASLGAGSGRRAA